MSASEGTIETNVPARLDRLPWSRFHRRVVMGLGTVWILDGLEVTIVGSVAARLTEKGSGISLTAGGIGTAAAIYVAGACLGALFFGQLTDRFGRKKLFMLTLAVYIAATVATAFAFAPWYLYLMRFFTGAGIGGEYAAINSAIDELIPARVRGRVDLMINGSYWIGAALGSVAALLFLNTDLFAKDFGWRLAFGCGAVLGLTIMVVRRHVPESPRWLFIHGREEEAEEIIRSIEKEVEEEQGESLPDPDETITIRQRKTVPFREIAAVAFQKYPKRAILCLALFIGQAFLYNAITFDLGTILTTYFKVASGAVPYFLVLFAVGNFLGPLVLGRLFDTIGRRIMVSVCYLGSAAAGIALVFFLLGGSHSQWAFIGLVCLTFFLASAGASAAYLTVSEIFPMETRALAIAFFYAVGTAIGGITGPLLFGHLIDSGKRGELAVGFVIGAIAMAAGGIAEVFLGWTPSRSRWSRSPSRSPRRARRRAPVRSPPSRAIGAAPDAPARRRVRIAIDRASARRPSTPLACPSRPTPTRTGSSSARSMRSAPCSRRRGRSTGTSSRKPCAPAAGGRGASVRRCGPRWTRVSSRG
jgi:MFS family permease